MNKNPVELAGLFRRLAAMVYDGFLLVALWFLTGGIIVAANGGKALTPIQSQLLLLPSILLVTVVFYSWFWVHGGQTLGMKTWRIRLVTDKGTPVSYKDTLIRILAAVLSLTCFGLGYFWLLADRNKSTWHDHLSNTRVVTID